jgi:hypothetical protein
VAETAIIVITMWLANNHFHLLVLDAMIPNDTSAAHPTWIEGMAAN